MIRRYICLNIAILTLLLIKVLWQDFTSVPEIKDYQGIENAEGRLAVGKKLDLCQVSVGDLELIKGISDTFAERLIEKRFEIYKAAKALPDKENHRAFEIIHGIGKSKAEKLKKYINPLGCKYSMKLKKKKIKNQESKKRIKEEKSHAILIVREQLQQSNVPLRTSSYTHLRQPE